MRDNILVKIIGVIFLGFILGTCEFEKGKEPSEIKKEIVKTDSINIIKK